MPVSVQRTTDRTQPDKSWTWKNMPSDKMLKILKQANEKRAQGELINIAIMKKNKKFQKDQLVEEGYSDIKEVYADSI